MKDLKKLIEKETVSGYEYKSAVCVRELFEQSGADVYIDKLSNVVAVKNKGQKFKVLVDAHMDTIGLMVTSITDGGFLKFISVGGVDQRILPALTVTVHGKEEVKGVIGVKPPHLLTDGKDKAYKLEELFIDTGYEKEEIEKLVSIGDIITFDSEYTELINGRIASSGLDDKAGVYMVSEILKKVNNTGVTVYGVGAIGEEIGLKGAKVLSNLDEIDLAFVIDVTHGTTPDAIKNRAFDLGKGPVITVGPSLSKKYNNHIKKYAEENKILLQTEVEPGNTGTNAWAYHSANESIPTVMISIPLKYMHTSYEVADKSDISAGIDLISGFINSMEV